MSNLTTRKIGFGMLMVLVLAFSVPSIVDAQSVSVTGVGTTDSGDTGIEFIESAQSTSNRFFNIRVNRAKDGQNIAIAYPDNTAGSSIEVPTSPAGASNNGGTASITFTAVDPSDDGTSITTAEREAWSWSGTIKVNYRVTAYGQFRVTVTPGGNPPWTGDDPDPITAYLVRDRVESRFSTFSGTPTILLKDSENGAKTISLTTTTSWTKVDFSITAGTGDLFFGGTAGRYVRSNKLYTTFPTGSRSFSTYTDGTSTVTVQFQSTSDTTATVKAQIPGATSSSGTHEVTIFRNSRVTVERISGNNQFGQVNSSSIDVMNRPQLISPLTVQVLDGTRRVGLKQGKVTFAVSAGGGALRYFSRTLYDNDGSTQVSNQPNNFTNVAVYTDNQGYAKAYLVLGTSAGPNMVTATMDGQSVTFTATATPAIRTGADQTVNRRSSTATPQINARHGTPNTPLTMSLALTSGSSGANVQVHFGITGGRIYLNPIDLDLTQPNYQTSLTTVTNNSGVATVNVQVNNGATARVTAQIVGNNTFSGRHTVTYFWNYPYIEYVSGNNQFGATGGRVENPLVVRVKDGPNGQAVPGQAVRFEETSTPSPGDTGVMRSPIPIPGTTVFVDTTTPTNLAGDSSGRPDSLRTRVATATVPAVGATTEEIVFVETDDDGEASVYLRLGLNVTSATPPVDETDVDHQVTASTPEGSTGGFSDSVQFTATAVADARQALLEIVSGDEQSAEKGRRLTDPLVVRVRTVEGYLAEGVALEFVVLDGTLQPNRKHGTNYATGFTGGSGNRIEVETTSDGTASVWYNVGQLRVARQVTVEVAAEQGSDQYDFEIDEVKFGVNGGQGTPAPAPAPTPAPAPLIIQVPPPVPRLIIEPASITGTPSSEHEITIRAEDENGIAVSVPSVAVGNLAFEQAGWKFQSWQDGHADHGDAGVTEHCAAV